MKRRSLVLTGLVLLALGLVGVQSWSIAVERIQQRVVALIEARTGLTVSAIERAEIALLPLPRISLSSVSFNHGETLSGKALRVRARARLLPLIAGRMDFARIDFTAPEISVAATGSGDNLSDWLTPPLTQLSRLQDQGKIVVTGGSVFIRSGGVIQTVLRNVNLVADGRLSQEPLLMSGTMNWRGAPIDFGLVWPTARSAGHLALNVTAPALKLAFDGNRSGDAEAVVNGSVSLSTRSLPELLDWFGERSRVASSIGALSLTGDAQIKPNDISLTNLIADLDGEKLVGAVKLGLAGSRSSLSGTLAGAQLDLGRLYRGLAIAVPSAEEVAALPFADWTSQDVDLRISVDAARAFGLKLGDVATYLMVKQGRFEAGLLRANAYGGSARGRLLAVSAPNGIDVKFQAALDKVNFSEMSSDLPSLSRFGGTGNAQLALDGVGRSASEIVASASGKGSVTLRQGEIEGFAFAELLRRLERNPALALRDWRKGKSAFATAQANVSIANGVATLSETQMTGAAYRLGVTGDVALPTGQIDISAQLSGTGGNLSLPFTLRGDWLAPELSLESGAASRPGGTTGQLPAATR